MPARRLTVISPEEDCDSQGHDTKGRVVLHALGGETTATRILIVEDNRRHAELIAEEVQESRLAAQVVSTATGRDALEKLSSDVFDLILLDYRLPDMDGIEFIRTLRAREMNVPVIFVTTADSVELAVQAMKLGAEDFLQKQEGYLEILPLLVREALERQQLRREKTRLEHQLRQSEKLASLGVLAAGLAHNINNRLTSLKTFFEIASSGGGGTAVDDAFLDLCKQDLDKIVVLVQELTRYALSDDAPPQESIAELIVRALGHLDDEMQRKQLILETDLADVPPIPVDAEGVKQLFINLLKNAIQASPVGGRIRVSLSVEDGRDRNIVARVEDNGPGLSPELRQKVFDPFFTTKDQGLGIGLYICHKIVAQHRGRIDVEDRQGGGAAFVIRLPIPHEESRVEAP
jgi:two-component system, NtrC family, sensor histidine kinase HydH